MQAAVQALEIVPEQAHDLVADSSVAALDQEQVTVLVRAVDPLKAS